MTTPSKARRHLTPANLHRTKADSSTAPPVLTTHGARGPEARPVVPPKDSPSPPPELPFTWKYAVGGSSSFERALSAVMDKLDAMEDTDATRGVDASRETARPVPRPPQQQVARPSQPCPKPRRPPEAQTTDRQPGAAATSTTTDKDTTPPHFSPPPADRTVDPLDRDISDRDVLWGLKTAVAAACDEDLDAWIRAQTGLRLRRFLCDLRAFGDLEAQMGAALRAPTPPGRPGPGPGPQRASAQEPQQARTERRRLEAERERRRRNQAQQHCQPGQDGL